MIHHVSLETRPADVEAELAWWGRLGFVQVEVPEGLRDRAVWMARGEQQLHLLLTEDPRTAGHLALVGPWPPPVDGFEERAQHWDEPRGYATSPGGHTVEIMAAPPASPPVS